jgi:hypothetical protein
MRRTAGRRGRIRRNRSVRLLAGLSPCETLGVIQILRCNRCRAQVRRYVTLRQSFRVRMLAERCAVRTCARKTARSCTSLQPCLIVSASAAAAAADASRCRVRAAACSASITSHRANTSLQNELASALYTETTLSYLHATLRSFSQEAAASPAAGHTTRRQRTRRHAPMGCSSCLTIAGVGTHLNAAAYKLI